jgi:penicillin-binding protein 1A
VRLKPGSIVRVVQDAKGNWSITQLPQVEGALVSLVPQDGAIRALIGGFDYNKNKFNHVTQAWRQPGSSFKPFIYSASLEKGLGPATIINDAPLYFPPTSPGGDAWEPKDDDQPDGPMSMRTPCRSRRTSCRSASFRTSARSTRRITSRRSSVSMSTRRRRICRSRWVPVSSRRCNSAGGYSVFANGGSRINPYLINEVPMHAAR